MNKELHPLDDFFRESLKDLRVAPSISARNRFLEKAAHIGGKRGPGFLRWFTIVAVVALVTTAVILYFLPAKQEHSTPQKSNSPIVSNNGQVLRPVIDAPVKSPDNTRIINTSVKNTSSSISEPGNISNRKSSLITSRTVKIQPPIVTPVISGTPEASATNEASRSVPETQQPFTIGNTASDQQAVSSNPGPLPAQGSGVSSGPQLFSSAPEKVELSKKPDDTFGLNQNVQVIGNKDSYSSLTLAATPWNFTPYIRYSFDWILNNNSGKASNTIGLEGQLQHGRFSISAGIGISVVKGYSSNQVLYNDYLGDYKKLDSITFSWDTKHYHLLPAYHMSEKKVWDSAVKADNFRVSNSYRLLHIPFMLGYDIIQRQKLILGLRAGATFTYCLDTRKLSGEYSAGQKKLVGISQGVDSYSGTNFYFEGEMFVSYGLTRRLLLELTPHFDYLLNPRNSQGLRLNNILIPAVRVSLKYKF